MQKRLSLFLTLLLLLSATASAKIEHLLPKPQQVVVGSGSLVLSGTVSITDPTSTTALSNFFTSQGMTVGTGGIPVTVSLVSSISGAYDYELAGFDNEAYKLTVTSSAVTIEAITQTGVIRAAQTLTQLAEGYTGTPELEACTITDWPAFKLRGYMHDVGRSFIDVDELKNEIDLLSRFKVNAFHWHLTDNQGFRFESKLYPALNASSSMTRFAGSYYTQAQCTAIEAYAKERGITIIPEIDMPGHSTAFTTAMGHTMVSTEGQAELVNIIGELASAFPNAPYLHLGFDESTTPADFIATMVAAVNNNGKKAGCWDPYGSHQIPTTSMGVELLSGWSSSARDVEGIPFIDSRYNYTNHFDVFADVVGIYKSTIDKVQRGNANVAGTVSAYWNDRKTATQEDIIKQNNFYANVLASAERAWIGGGNAYIEQGGVMLPNSGTEYDEFADWENRFLFHKAHSLSAEPIPYVKQTNVHWNITDAFPNGGDATLTLPPETDGLQDSYTYDGTTYGVTRATGAGIYLRHVWGTTIPAFYSNPQINHTAYAWTYVYSPTAQDVGAQIEFHNYGRSENDTAPDAGKWDRKGSRIWLNDTEILPPTWTNTGVSINSEVDLGNENFTARTPITVHLNQGWNKVFLKLPYVNASGIRLNKWMFTFVLTDATGTNAVDGLIYSPAKAMDENADQVASKISELRAYERSVCGTAVGYYPTSAAADMEAVIATIEATISESGYTAEQRAAQIATLETALTTFQNSLSSASVNQPEAATGVNDLYYTLMSNRNSRYLTSAGAGSNAAGNTAVTDASYWKFVSRGDDTWDIVNSDGSYLAPTTSAIQTAAAQPSSGWSLRASSIPGYVVIVNDGGSHAQLNQANSGTTINNWGYGSKTAGEYRLDDAGCQYFVVAHPEFGEPFPLPSTDCATHFYTLVDGRNSRYATSYGNGNAPVGDASVSSQSYWKFVDRGDDTYDIVNYDGTYLTPNTTYNAALTTSTTQPSSGWSLGASATDGKYIIYNDGASHTQVNATKVGQGYKLYNWGYGSYTAGEYRLDDVGCQFTITEVPDIVVPASFTPTASSGSTEYFYTLQDYRGSRYATSQGNGNAAVGNTAASNESRWKFVSRGDNTYDIVNYDGTYLTPNTTTNTAVTTSTTQPATGWALGASSTSGYYIIYNAGTGNTQLNLTTEDQNYQLYNRGYDSGSYNLCDGGCQFAIAAASEDIPETAMAGFIPTTLDANGRPVASTKWYTMTIHTDAYRISKQAADASYISLSTKGTATPAGTDLWCFVGDDTNGFTIYNAAGGVLVYPKTQSGSQGGTSYVLVKDLATLETDTYGSLWTFAASTYRTGGTATPVYMQETSSGNNYAVNKCGTPLAFWTTGRDAGSTILIEPTDYLVYYVDANTGAFGDSNNYHTAWLSTLTDPAQIRISNERGNMWYYDGALHMYQTLNQGAYTIKSLSGSHQVYGWGGTAKGWSGSDRSSATRGVTAISGQGLSSATIAADSYKEVHLYNLNNNATLAVGTSTAASNVTFDDFYVLLEPEKSLTPFTPTTIEAGDFASTTQWYTLGVGASTMQVLATNDANATSVEEQMVLANTDDALWCFVGNETEGYYIYNRGLGADKVLAVSTSATDGTLPVFVTLSTLDTSLYNARWMFKDGTVSTTYYAKPAGQDLKLRHTDRAGVLKLSTTSDLLYNLYIKEAESVAPAPLAYVVSKIGNGTFTRSNNSTASYNAWAKTWTSTQTPTVLVENTAAVGNMDLLGDDNLRLDNATGSNGTFRITAPSGYTIKGYVIDFTNDTTNPATSIRSDEEGGPVAVVGAGETGQLLVDNLYKQQTTFTVVSSGRSATTASNFTIYIQKDPDAGSQSLYIFPNHVHGGSTEDGTNYTTVPYRIPALAKLRDGSLLAAADFRYCKLDIGYGPIDIHGRKRDASGNWGSIFTIADGDNTQAATNFNYAFGDPALVADRESDNVLMMSCGGKVVFVSSTAANPQHPVRFLSTDGGETWTTGTDMTEQVFAQFTGTAATGTCNGVFFSSGRITQSRYVKTGNFYRIYSAVPVRGTAGNGTAVLYSDDFGETWTRLGSGDVYPCSTCDEAKVEEMPDGRVMLSVRVSGSRKFNVYTYTNSATAAGFWSNEAAYNSGTNACNGEHLLVPAKRVSDNANVFVCLMSLPQSGSRENVGFYYKEIADFSDYADGTAMAADWNRSLQVSTTTSCYSTMQQLEDGTIAFLYEENLLDGGYDIVFKEYALEDLTDGLYTFNTGYEETAANRLPYLQSTFEGLPQRLVGTYVGSRKEEDILASSDVISAGTAYTASPSQTALESYIGAVMSVPRISLHAGKPYRLYNKLYPTMTLSSNGTALTSATANTADMTQLFIVEDAGDGTWYLKNAINQDYAAQTGSRSTAMASTSTPVAYKIVSNEKGETYLQCANPTDATYSAIHMDSSKNIVVWTPAYTSDASYWMMEPIDAWDWTLATPSSADTAYGTAYLPFAVQLPANTDAYTISISDDFHVATPTLIEGGLVPAYTPVLLTQSEALTDVSFTVPDAASTVVPTTALVGTLKAITDYDADNTFVFSSDPNDSKVVGFYRFSGTQLKANRAYLLRSTSSDVRGYRLVFDDVTGITLQPIGATDGAAVYDLQGRRVVQPKAGNVYIVDGKKVLMK